MDVILDHLRFVRRCNFQTAFVCGLVIVVNLISVFVVLFKKG